MLDYLVTSQVRRSLLRLLWRDGASGSVSALARQAGVSFAAAHRELESMLAANLVQSERAGAGVVYRSNSDHPQAELLRRLAASKEQRGTPDRADHVRRWLHALGAPLTVEDGALEMPTKEEVVAEGVALAHFDASAARVLPVLLWKRRQDLDWESLVHEATRRNERHALGLFLELAGELGRDNELVTRARQLRDRRQRRPKPFFAGAHGRYALAATRRNTPAVARRWGYLMNMGLDSFTSAFAKHAAA